MRLTRVTVSGLFGMFNHDIRFPAKDNVVIVHGPNGFGKTAMLKMIGSLVSGQSEAFLQVPFETFSLTFDDGTVRRATRTSAEGDLGRASVTLMHQTPDGQSYELPPPAQLSTQVLDQLDSYVPRLSRSKDGWRDSQGRFYSLSEVVSMYPSVYERIPAEYRRSLEGNALQGFRVFFVDTNRLFGVVEAPAERLRRYYLDTGDLHGEDSPPLRVVQYSAELTKRIQAILATYAKHSQESDRTFPERLVHFLRTNQRALSAREILGEMAELEESRQRLIDLGILDTEKGLRDLTEDDVTRARDALTIYVSDVRLKLRVFDEIVVRIGMLRDIVNALFRYKTLAISRERGLFFRTARGTTVSPSHLSSGEQHQLVLLYELLFMVPKNGLVLIDEPEISLHLAWQSRFLRDLLSILDITGGHAIVATHAPAIIGTRWDLAVGLDGPDSENGDVNAR